MATRIYLGEPPAKIKQWIIDHYLVKDPPVDNTTLMSYFDVSETDATTYSDMMAAANAKGITVTDSMTIQDLLNTLN